MSGPSYCRICGEWPGNFGKNGDLCHTHYCVEICRDHPVPLPRDQEMKTEIVRLYRSTNTPLPPSYEEVYDPAPTAKERE